MEAGVVINGQYRLGERIAAGGMGVVFRAEQIALSREVAIKFIHPELAVMPGLVARFDREAQAASRISHPNAVSIIDYGVTAGGVPFLVMEYVRGTTLTQLLRHEGPLRLDRAIDLTVQILDALIEAHACGVVHADLKSENVLVEPLAGRGEVVKVVDFGLARVLAADQAREPDDDPDTVTGTPEYLAPELVSGATPTVASDLYAVGVILYELLTGTTPFEASSTVDVLDGHVHDPVVPPSLRRPDREVSPAVDRACLRALAKSPADRFADAAAFATALENARPILDPTDERCPHCGRAKPLAAPFCPECGGTAIPEAIDRDAPTQPIVVSPEPPRRRVPTPIPASRRAAHLRRRIGSAIAQGQVEEMIASYLELARVLVTGHHDDEAIAELVEAIDLVTADGAVPRSLWRLMLALARLYQRAGRDTLAQHCTEEAVRHARV